MRRGEMLYLWEKAYRSLSLPSLFALFPRARDTPSAGAARATRPQRCVFVYLCGCALCIGDAYEDGEVARATTTRTAGPAKRLGFAFGAAVDVGRRAGRAPSTSISPSNSISAAYGECTRLVGAVRVPNTLQRHLVVQLANIPHLTLSAARSSSHASTLRPALESRDVVPIRRYTEHGAMSAAKRERSGCGGAGAAVCSAQEAGRMEDGVGGERVRSVPDELTLTLDLPRPFPTAAAAPGLRLALTAGTNATGCSCGA
ncbi:hypothetical protein B0H17DRAFT_1218291 [Mycena rosella]|uniref:Uncharacterized protein n=1 Tax=Mycena rosella TaxID=1033263 RepID=A0AAD7BSA0_MYCRO|nr:hypothetical protein B0H17DRAFT_1218291 [Mycena rosella]